MAKISFFLISFQSLHEINTLEFLIVQFSTPIYFKRQKDFCDDAVLDKVLPTSFPVFDLYGMLLYKAAALTQGGHGSCDQIKVRFLA